MTLQIKLDETVIHPGEQLKGLVVWDFDSVPSKITLAVSWQTSGKGSDDSETVLEEDWVPDSKSGERKFAFQMPRGPISVNGNLISIAWQIECTSKRPSAASTIPFVLSQMDRPIRLSALAANTATTLAEQRKLPGDDVP